MRRGEELRGEKIIFGSRDDERCLFSSCVFPFSTAAALQVHCRRQTYPRALGNGHQEKKDDVLLSYYSKDFCCNFDETTKDDEENKSKDVLYCGDPKPFIHALCRLRAVMRAGAVALSRGFFVGLLLKTTVPS